MAWYDEDSFLTRGLGPYLSTILITALIAFTLPVFLHFFIFRAKTPTSLPTFLVIGPSGSGKTSLVTLFEKGAPSPTHLSQSPLSVRVSLPSTTKAASSKYRSENDPTLKLEKPLLLVDTPGHGKLRHFGLEHLNATPNLKGIIYVVDAASIPSSSTGSSSESGLADAAEYLHDILLVLQKRYTTAKSSKGPKDVPVLIAANKLDLFTALPAPLLKTSLEKEISRVRETRAKGLLTAGSGDADADDRGWLGEGGESKFEFRQMEEVNVPVQVVGGNVLGSEGPDVDKWWDWIGSKL
ncbi:P-loop containing nucleoside triphosphate hydrolase protein [Aulographum hederae CBS 113979]|uniref:Signal recognition particle receptor subunit beta n=1 Tax=Aulographum hederae CBS 113979 TaxID=1176131 RepID=A0A6G1H2H4_9PEZI|nr:P-loop containing nucleoside triphosphate hydrolase protein [Aulographum hederae CBS 113979]